MKFNPECNNEAARPMLFDIAVHMRNKYNNRLINMIYFTSCVVKFIFECHK